MEWDWNWILYVGIPAAVALAVPVWERARMYFLKRGNDRAVAILDRIGWIYTQVLRPLYRKLTAKGKKEEGGQR